MPPGFASSLRRKGNKNSEDRHILFYGLMAILTLMCVVSAVMLNGRNDDNNGRNDDTNEKVKVISEIPPISGGQRTASVSSSTPANLAKQSTGCREGTSTIVDGVVTKRCQDGTMVTVQN